MVTCFPQSNSGVVGWRYHIPANRVLTDESRQRNTTRQSRHETADGRRDDNTELSLKTRRGRERANFESGTISLSDTSPVSNCTSEWPH